jgi:spore coat protein A, manganese oxidase
MKLSRRNLIKIGLLSGGVIAFSLGIRRLMQKSSSPTLRYFQAFLPIPPTLEPIRRDATTDYYELTVQRNWVEFLPGRKTEIWGYNGIMPGPTIRQRGGRSPTHQRKTVLRVINKLDQDSEGEPLSLVTHLHGMASLPQYDGYTMDIVAPGFYKDYHYPNDRAASLWYHDHSMDKTSRNIQMGLAGMYIVEDDYELNLPLPKGDYDIPLILQNKRLATDGSLFRDADTQTLYGEIDLVNGAPWPRLEVANRKYRFRILNTSAARTYRLMLSRSSSETTPETLVVIGGDGGLLAEPVSVNMPTESLRVAAAERYDAIVDFARYPVGSQVFLHHLKTVTQDGVTTHQLSPVMRFDIVRTANDDSSIPRQFRSLEVLKPTPTLPTRTFLFKKERGKWVINHLGWDHDRIDANPGAGATEIWVFKNPEAGRVHPVHVHLAEAQILDRNGKPPLPYERGWKDTFFLGERETIRAIVRFPSRDGQPIQGKYMMHCHNLDHEDNAMMIQFEVGHGGPDPVATAPAKLYRTTAQTNPPRKTSSHQAS